MKHLVSFNRSPTWISAEIGEEFAPQGRETKYSREEIKERQENPAAFLEYRKRVESSLNQLFDVFHAKSAKQKETLIKTTELMKKRLNYNEAIASKVIPTWGVGCRRLTPGVNYLETLIASNVFVEIDEILNATPKGLCVVNGQIHEVDAIVCATGFDTSYRPNFPLIGIDGKDLRDVWQHDPESYFSVSASGFPNYFSKSSLVLLEAYGASSDFRSKFPLC